MKLRCIIFDLDGTLAETNRLIFDSFNYIVKKYRGMTMPDQEITALFGPPEEGALLTIVGEENLETAMKEYLEFYKNNHQTLARMVPGMKEVLADVRRRRRILALFTGKGIHTTTITLVEFGISQYFDAIVTGNDVLEHKPSAEGIRKVLDRFGLAQDEVLMVGDSVADVKASRDAGIPIAAVLWDSYGKDRVLSMGTDYLFHTVGEFHEWLKESMKG
ncbi:MAG: HAD family hydrolase [Ignavibacteriales bacterium]|nr:HAD family hydrolase [Ignavibacteriales bacterium]